MPAKPGKAFYLLAVIWLLVQAALWYYNGTGITDEAEKYIGQAYHLQSDHYIDDTKYVFYFIPVFIIFISLIFHLGFAFVVIVQIVVNALATVAFYKICKSLLKNDKGSILATILFITFIPLQYWNTFLYTESIFYSLCIFFMYSYIVLPAGKASTHLIRGAIILALLFTRPLGILFIPVTAFYYLAQSKLKPAIKWLAAVTACIAVYFLVNFLYHSSADMDILMPQLQGSVICFGPQEYTNSNLQIIHSGNPANDLGYFVIHNTVYFSKLAFSRALSFFNLYRSYYSPLHNAYLILSMIFLYGFAFRSFTKSPLGRIPAFKYIFLPLVFIFCAGVMLQCDDFNSRFSMPLFPWIILLAIDGVFITMGAKIEKNL